MTVKEIWTDLDFEEMGWHDSEVYAFWPLREDLVFALDIDYIFQWVHHPQRFSFWVAPCTLRFEGVLHLRMNLDFDNRVGLYILDISRTNPRPLHTRNGTAWDYRIETDAGDITFEASSYQQFVRKQPVHGYGQSLQRDPLGRYP